MGERHRPRLPASTLAPHDANSLLLVVSTGAVLGVFLCLLRVRWLIRWGDLQLNSPTALIRDLATAFVPDLTYVVILIGILLGLTWLARHQVRLQRQLARLVLPAAVLTLILAHVNLRAVQSLGRPVNYQWLYYSHFLNSFDARNALAVQLDAELVRQILVRSALLVAFSYALAWVLRWAARRIGARRLVLAALTAEGAFFEFAAFLWPTRTLDDSRLANPVFAFVESLAHADRAPSLMAAPTSVGAADFLTVAQQPGHGAPSRTPITRAAREARVRNVVVLVLESVAAQYVGAYGAPYGATPDVDRHSPHALRFVNMYAHAPSTIHSLVSLLLSAYAPLSYRMLSVEQPRIALPSLSGQLKQRGYRTAFFNAADNRFQGEDAFLAERGFDRVEDHRSVACAKGTFRRTDLAEGGSPGQLASAHDECAVTAFGRWLDASQPTRPFFAMIWTAQTHYPYFISEPSRRYDVQDTLFNRYLNALRESQQSLSQLVGMLSDRGLLDSTLVVVVGDHGTLFNQHRVTTKRQLFQEDVNIPFLLINHHLFNGQVDSTIGGMIDVAPTIMDILGFPLPGTWQGRSLFSSNRSGRAYFFSPFSNVLFGFREGRRKLIYDAGGDEMMVFDLVDDPHETTNLAPSLSQVVAVGRERLAAWVQYQAQFYRQRLGPAAR